MSDLAQFFPYFVVFFVIYCLQFLLSTHKSIRDSKRIAELELGNATQFVVIRNLTENMNSKDAEMMKLRREHVGEITKLQNQLFETSRTKSVENSLVAGLPTPPPPPPVATSGFMSLKPQLQVASVAKPLGKTKKK